MPRTPTNPAENDHNLGVSVELAKEEAELILKNLCSIGYKGLLYNVSIRKDRSKPRHFVLVYNVSEENCTRMEEEQGLHRCLILPARPDVAFCINGLTRAMTCITIVHTYIHPVHCMLEQQPLRLGQIKSSVIEAQWQATPHRSAEPR